MIGALDAIESLLDQELVFPAGLFGFPNARRFQLKRFDGGDGAPSPFLLLASLDEDLSFALLHPDYVVKEYAVPVADELLKILEAESRRDLVPLAIVTVRDRLDEISVNLQGPLLINSVARLGIQVVLENYPVRHPLVPPS